MEGDGLGGGKKPGLLPGTAHLGIKDIPGDAALVPDLTGLFSISSSP